MPMDGTQYTVHSTHTKTHAQTHKAKDSEVSGLPGAGPYHNSLVVLESVNRDIQIREAHHTPNTEPPFSNYKSIIESG